MNIELSAAWVWAVTLCLVRIAPVLALTPVLGGLQVPARVKAAVLLMLAVTLITPDGAGVQALVLSDTEMARAAASELLFGAVLAFGVHAAFAVFDFAGRILDVQMGFSLGSIFDPITREPSPLMSSAFGMLATTVFFLLNMPHHLILVLSTSLTDVPIGTAVVSIPLDRLMEQFGALFTLGLSLAAPVVFLLFLVDIGMAVMSRSVPQLNVLFIGMPVKVLVGLLLLALVVPQWGSAFVHVLQTMIGP